MRSPATIFDLSPPGHPANSLVVLLRQRQDGRSPQYYARRIAPPQTRKSPRNPYVMKALGAVSLERAKELAWQWWTQDQEHVSPNKTELFEVVSADYLATLEAKTLILDRRQRPSVNPKKYTRHEQSIRLHINPFFKSIPVSKISLDDVERWLEWRRMHHLTDIEADNDEEPATSKRRFLMPARSTIQKDAVAFSAVIRHARLQLHIDTTFVPELPVPSQTEDTRRPRFYPDEWQKIVGALYDRMNSSVGARGPLSENSIWLRQMLFLFVITLHGTGLRVAEGMRLKVKHLRRIAEDAARREAFRKELLLTVGGPRGSLSQNVADEIINEKVDGLYQYRVIVDSDSQLKHYTHKRIVIPTVDMTGWFDQLLRALALNLDRSVVGEIERPEQLSPEQWLFCHLNGARIKSFDNGFDELLDSLRLLYHDGKKRSLTSIRHTYASERIETGVADLKSIADNMGTTVDMLYKHYAQEIRELRAADLQTV